MNKQLSKPTTILFVSEYAGFMGGIEQYVFQVAQWLREEGYRLELLFRDKTREPERYLSVFHTTSTDLEQLSGEPALVMIHRIWDETIVAQVMAHYGSRVALTVHDHDLYCPRRYYYTPFGRSNCSRAYSPLRCGLCGSLVSPRHWTNGLYAMLHQTFVKFNMRFKLARQIPHLVVLSDFMRKNLMRNGFDASCITVLPPAIHLPSDCRLPDSTHFKNEPPCIGFVGQLLRGKGADVFLATLQELKKQGKKFQAFIAGDGPDRGMLENIMAATGLYVEMPGFVAPQEWYSRCDILLLPFRWQEPFGLVGAEAAANAVPVVASELGGVRSWMKPGETGLIVPPGDVAAFASAVGQLLDDPALCARLGRNARDYAMEQFSLSRFLKNIADLIEKISKTQI
jgi:glycosyltransferase involved in cell wall biosynthesis